MPAPHSLLGRLLGVPPGLGVGFSTARFRLSRTFASASRLPAQPSSAHVFQVKEGRNKIVLSQGDLTEFDGDAIVNAANERMLGGGGVDGAIHAAAGRQLYAECKSVPEVAPRVRCPTGEARLTKGYNLPAKHVIHTVGPIYESDEVSAPLLDKAYRNSLKLANEHGFKRIAFPAISCGVFGYPRAKAAQVSLEAVLESIGTVDEVHFILFGKDTMDAWLDAAHRMIPPTEHGDL